MQQHSPALLDLDWLVRSFVRSFEFVEILKDVVDLLSRKRASAPSVSKLQPLLLSSPLLSSLFVHLRHFSLEAAATPLSRTVQIQSWFERILSSWLRRAEEEEVEVIRS